MHLNIQGRHISITPALNEHVKNKLKKIKYYFDHIIHVSVILEAVTKNEHVAEATITVGHHHFHNKVKGDDMYRVIDALFGKMEVHVRRYKEYLTDKKKKNQKNIVTMELLDSQKKLESEELKVDLEELLPNPKPMDKIEAMLQLQALDKKRIWGFYQEESEKHLSYLIPEDESNKFSLICFDHVWEKHQLVLLDTKRYETTMIESLRPSTEAIEDAVFYLLDHPEQPYRFFISVRTHESALILHTKGKHFQLLREIP